MAAVDLLDEPQTEAAAIDTSESLYEEIDGRRVELPPISKYAAKLINRLNRHLGSFTESHNLGETFVEMLFALPLKGRQRNRRPDVAFVPFDRWPKDRAEDPIGNAWEVVPSLIIEVVSPTDLAEELNTKVLEYFEAGVSQVWVVHPLGRSTMVYSSPNDAHRVNDSEPLEAGSIVPGWSLRLADILPPVQAPPPTN